MTRVPDSVRVRVPEPRPFLGPGLEHGSEMG